MSTLKADTIQSTSGGAATLTKQQAAKAYCTLPSASISVSESHNVSSVTDLSGSAPNDFEVNFTSSMNTTSYCVATSAFATANRQSNHNNKATGKYEVNVYFANSPSSSTSNTADSSVLGDLA
jgi:hypothetical protein